MPKTAMERQEQVFSPAEQPYRAANLEFDYCAPDVIRNYIPTAKSVAVLDVVSEALEKETRDRAISLIAPYGSGKTSLLLFLSALLEGNYKTKPVLAKLLRRVEQISPSTARFCKRLQANKKGYVVVPLSGYQGDVTGLFARGLRDALASHRLGRIWQKLSPPKEPSQVQVLDLYRVAAKEVVKSGYKGIALIYDEFGKVLESQQGETRPADLFFFQSFAELCARSGSHKLVILVALHQGFAQYAQRLPGHIRTEWAKIEGRFRVIHYIEDSFQVYELIAQTLGKLRGPAYETLKGRVAKLAKHYATATGGLPCFASLKNKEDRYQIFLNAFPLHPLALYVLPRLSARVAQNERTLFHFLLGNEDQCFSSLLTRKDFSQRKPEVVSLAELYEYFSQLMATDNGIGGTYRRLVEIRAALERINPADTLAIKLTKTIGLLSLVGERQQAPATLEMLQFALEEEVDQEPIRLRRALDQLVSKKILLHRRHSGEYRIWEGSDVDLLSVLRQRKAEVEAILDVAAVVSGKIRAPIILPHRYNEDFCMIRVFEGQYVTVHELEKRISSYQDDAWLQKWDGKIFYVLADTLAEVEVAKELAQRLRHRNVLIAIPAKPLNLTDTVAEFYCIEQLLHDTAFIAEDPVIRRELSELADDCLVNMRSQLGKFQNPKVGEITWWHSRRLQDSIRDRVTLRRYLSEICSTVFAKTPKFNNEIINRRRPSATLVNARKKVLRALLSNYGAEDLNLAGYGPDVSMFRAVYLNTGLYRETRHGKWRFVEPDQIEDKNLRIVIKVIHDFYLGSQDAPQSMSVLLEKLIRPPYGIREGVLPLILVAGTKSFLLPLNLMDQGVYVKELKAETFERMVTDPDQMTVQCVPLPIHVLNYLTGIRTIFSVSGAESCEVNDPLRATVETVYRWFHQLPPCALASSQLSREAQQIRSILIKATDPVHLLFIDMPQVIMGVEGRRGDNPWLSEAAYSQILQGINGLRSQLDAVLVNYLNQVALITRRTFMLSDGGIQGLRDELRKWVDSCAPDLKEFIDDPQCSGMLDRIKSEYETDVKLAESLASLVTGKSLAHWDDSYLKQYELGLISLYAKLTYTNRLLDKRLGMGQAEQVKDRITDPELWKRLEELDTTQKELLAFYLIHMTRKGGG